MDNYERYHSDPQFAALVDMFTAQLHNCDFTPSEVRLAAMMATINLESMRTRTLVRVTPEIDKALHDLHIMINEEKSP